MQQITDLGGVRSSAIMADSVIMADMLPSGLLPPPPVTDARSIQLGRLVLNTEAPHQGFIDPDPNFEVSVAVSRVRIPLPVPGIRRFSGTPNLLSYLGLRDVLLVPAQVMSYELSDSGAWFERALQQAAVRAWLKAAKNCQKAVYLIVGVHTKPPTRLSQSTLLIGTPKVGGAPNATGEDMLDTYSMSIPMSKKIVAISYYQVSFTKVVTHHYCPVPEVSDLCIRDEISLDPDSHLPVLSGSRTWGDMSLGVQSFRVPCSGYVFRGPRSQRPLGTTVLPSSGRPLDGRNQLPISVNDLYNANEGYRIVDANPSDAEREYYLGEREMGMPIRECGSRQDTILTHNGNYANEEITNCENCISIVDESPPLSAVLYRLDTTFYGNRVVHIRGRQLSPVEAAHEIPESWSRVKVLGEGGQATVFLEESESAPKLRAVKKIPQRLLQTHNLGIEREMQALLALKDHTELFVQFLGWYEDKAKENVYIAMEYVPHGDLGQYLSNNGSEGKNHAQSITQQLLNGIAVLQRKHICHRDLKPQNILIACLSPIQVKLADFGVAKSTVGTELRTRCGTRNYMAPELLELLPPALRLKGRLKYTNAVDMWALGVLVYEILASRHPFQIRPPESLSGDSTRGSEISGVASSSSQMPIDTYLVSEFCKGNIELPTDILHQSQTADHAIHFIKRLIVADPRSRMSAADGLKHQWFMDP